MVKWIALLLLCLQGCAVQTGDDDMIRHSWGLTGNLTTKGQGSVKLQKTFITDTQDESGYYTVQFGVTPPPGTTYSATATITFKVNGQQVVRQVSVGQGTSISGVCEAIDIVVLDTSKIAGITAGVQYSVSINVVKGTRSSTANPPTLIGQASARSAGALTNLGFGPQNMPANGDTVTYPVPQGSGVSSFEIAALSNGATPPTTNIEVLCIFGGFISKSYNLVPGMPGFVDLPSNCDTVLLTNFDTSGAPNVSAALTWGIDG